MTALVLVLSLNLSFFISDFLNTSKSKHMTSWFISHSLDLNLKAVAVISQYKGTFLKSTFK